MTDHAAGEWFLVIDLGTLGLSAEVGGVMVTLPDGVLRIPFATEASVVHALSRLELSIDGPPVVLQGEVISGQQAIEDGHG